jgi:hypothetical protein
MINCFMPERPPDKDIDFGLGLFAGLTPTYATRRRNGCSTECSAESEKLNLFLGKGVHHENSQVFDNLLSFMLFVYW